MNTRMLRSALLLGAGILALGILPEASGAQQNQQDQTAPAQQASPAPGGRMHGQKMLQELSLTEDQQAQIKKIHQDAKAKADAIRADNSLTDADRQAKIRAIRRASMKQVHAVLTPEQREQLREKMRERRAARQQQQPS
jgi:protein CpxP